MKAQQAEKLTADFLAHHRYDSETWDGWIASYDIYTGIKKDLNVRVHAFRLYPALDNLMECVPPRVEDTWMVADKDGRPITGEQYDHPNQPNGARRFYRALGDSVEYIPLPTAEQ